MTIDEAIKEIKDASDSEVRYGDKEHHYNEVMKRVEAFDLAIKALEQTDALDKIRAEIVKMKEGVSKMLMPFDGLEKVQYTTGFIDGLGSTLDIIDKYKSESEDNHG